MSRNLAVDSEACAGLFGGDIGAYMVTNSPSSNHPKVGRNHELAVVVRAADNQRQGRITDSNGDSAVTQHHLGGLRALLAAAAAPHRSAARSTTKPDHSLTGEVAAADAEAPDLDQAGQFAAPAGPTIVRRLCRDGHGHRRPERPAEAVRRVRRGSDRRPAATCRRPTARGSARRGRRPARRRRARSRPASSWRRQPDHEARAGHRRLAVGIGRAGRDFPPRCARHALR